MTVLILVGLAVIGIGLALILPTTIKQVTYKGTATGVITRIESKMGNDVARAYYQFVVDGVTFQSQTGWLSNYQFIHGKEYVVKYNVSNPSQSYLQQKVSSFVTVAVGVVFALAGIAIILIGMSLKSMM